MRVCVRARREDYRDFHIPFFTLLHSPLPSVEKNDTSVSTKQHVGFNKTTRRFQQNNVSFLGGKCRNRQRGAEKESTQAQTIFFHSVREILQIGFKTQKHTLHLGRILTGKIMFQIGISGFVIKA